MAQRGAFRCSFARRNCHHEQLFHAEYQRTNRTKENKILRCFPHCCPDHVRRSYCGSSLHLQVDFHAGDGALAQPQKDDDLLVFGRFRPLESRALAVGDRLAGAAILSSLQSEDNPTGEWIEAWLVASADQNAWLYEVNHAARWYYNWGSSAAKDKRLKQHVFEVCVLHQSSDAPDAFQVAAVSCSPPFKLLSFRRAPADVRRRGRDEGAEQLSLSEEDAAMLKIEQAQRPKSAPTTKSTSTSRELLESSAQRWTTAEPQRLSAASSLEDEEKRAHASPYEPPALRLPSQSSSGLPPVRLPSLLMRHSTQSPSFGLKRAGPASLLHEPLDSATTLSVASPHSPVPAWLQGPRESTLDETRSASPAVHGSGSLTQLQVLTIVIRFLRALPLASVLAHIPTLESEFRSYTVALGATPSSSIAGSHVERLLHELGESPQLRNLQRPLDEELVAVAARLSLWLQCDPDLQLSRESMHLQAASSLLYKTVLLETHEQYVRWLHHQIEAFLRRCGWSLEDLVSAISQAETTPISENERGTTVAFADFVAQAREQFVSREEASAPAIRRRLHRLNMGPSLSTVRPSRLSGVWRSELSSVRVRRLGPVESMPLDAVLWFWRQLGCVAVTLKPSSSVAATALEVKSAFATSESVLRLVCDGRARWFRAFPAGEASGAVTIGDQSFGDYQAIYKPPLDSVECAMYSWPSTAASAAFRWRWQLTPTASTALVVQLIVERGSLQSVPIEIESLVQKCNHVSRWDRVALADWTIER